VNIMKSVREGSFGQVNQLNLGSFMGGGEKSSRGAKGEGDVEGRPFERKRKGILGG